VAVTVNDFVIPKTKLDFAQNNVSAKWAPGYPKAWGSEDFSYQFNEPSPDDVFGSVVTEDEKYLALFNGSHVRFVDLDTNATASTFSLRVPDGNVAQTLALRPASKGGYDVFTTGARYRYDYAAFTVRQYIGPDLQPVGPPITYEGGIGAISKQGKLASPYGYIYDLETTSDTPVATLDGQPDITDLSFAPDGVHLASVSWHKQTADLWNATSGEKIFAFPATKAQNWAIRFSPDGKYIAIVVGSGNMTVQIHTLSNLTAAPLEIKGFNDWPRQLDWSPTSQQMIIGDNGRLRVFNIPTAEVVQTWQVDVREYVYNPVDPKWIDNGSKLTWVWRDGRYLYDFDKNVEWLWTVRNTDHSWGSSRFSLLKKRGYAVTHDGDSTVRFWKV
jgi:WD40 repeat protein